MPQILSHSKKAALNITQALHNEPSFVSLSQKISYSKALWGVTIRLLPSSLTPHCTASSYSEGEWCILVNSPSTAAKLKQLSPSIVAHLRHHGYNITKIRIKLSHNREH
jgi:hypothetical protein